MSVVRRVTDIIIENVGRLVVITYKYIIYLLKNNLSGAGCDCRYSFSHILNDLNYTVIPNASTQILWSRGPTTKLDLLNTSNITAWGALLRWLPSGEVSF